MTLTLTNTYIDAGRIPPLAHAESGALAHTELARFLAVVEALSGDDWQQPTDCTAWTVRDILAHEAGSCAGYASFAEFRNQITARPGPGQMPVDAINARQLADRAGRGPADLIAELRRTGPRAIATRQRLPWVLRKIPVPFGPPLGTRPVGYLTDLIYPRDMWMHRMDICRATGRPFHQTPEHDGRLLALVMRDLDEALRPLLNGQACIYHVTGAAGGHYRLGAAVEPSAAITIALLELNRLASGRLSAAEAERQGLAGLSGDLPLAQRLLQHTSVPY